MTGVYTGKREPPWCQLRRQWWYRRLSWQQLPVAPVTTKLVSWRLSGFIMVYFDCRVQSLHTDGQWSPRHHMLTFWSWKRFPHYWPFVKGNRRSSVHSLQKWSVMRSCDPGAVMFNLIWLWITVWQTIELLVIWDAITLTWRHCDETSVNRSKCVSDACFSKLTTPTRKHSPIMVKHICIRLEKSNEYLFNK